MVPVKSNILLESLITIWPLAAIAAFCGVAM
jgi:hypothetical protein